MLAFIKISKLNRVLNFARGGWDLFGGRSEIIESLLEIAILAQGVETHNVLENDRRLEGRTVDINRNTRNSMNGYEAQSMQIRTTCMLSSNVYKKPLHKSVRYRNM